MSLKRPSTGPPLLRPRDGAVVPIVAICMVLFIICAAIAIDVGMLYNTRSESQRASDAAALAAAATYYESTLGGGGTAQAEDAARAAAVRWAGRNQMLGTDIAPAEVVNVQFIQESGRVRVTLQRPAVQTWFAGIFGINTVPVGSRSAALIVGSGTAGCLKPFAVPDNAYDPAAYGELRRVVDSGNDAYVLIGFGGGPPGGGNFHDDIRLSCNNRTARISLSDPWVWAKPSGGLPPGQIRLPFNDLYATDPGLSYNAEDGEFYRNGVIEDDWRSSPRVANVAIVDDGSIVYNPTGSYMVQIVDFVSVFFEGPGVHSVECGATNNAYCSTSSKTWVFGRFFPAVGQADNCVATNTCAPSLYRLRLVE
jgi:Flp pilus assembly protein TadG